MFDRIINILVIESDAQAMTDLLSIIQNPGNNVFKATNETDALKLMGHKDFVLIFCSIDFKGTNSLKLLSAIAASNASNNSTVIVTSCDQNMVNNTVGQFGAMDYLIKPFVPNIVKAKLGVYRKLYFKHLRISRLLESILPTQTLSEFSLFGKSSPKKKKNACILFTDFVNFTKKTQNVDPQEIVKKLDFYFSKFDEIILKYKLEKIKTIGDAYMVVGGVTEGDPFPHLRTALAALEIRNFIITDNTAQQALQRDYWEIRIGIHSGDLVAGVVGTHKFSFDVWGNAVNVAARCEQHSTPNQINISGTYYGIISSHFDCSSRGKIAIKNSGSIDMYFLNKIKPQYSLYNEGRIPNLALRKSVGLPSADFIGLRNFILTKLKAELSDKLLYHSWEHTKIVEEAVIKYGELENLSPNDLFLVRTAALFHDSGFLFRYTENEQLSVDLFRLYGPKFGYQKADIEKIERIILATVIGTEPKTLLECVMCDADLDYLGRLDYHVTAEKLFKEMEKYGQTTTPGERIKMQIDYLENIHTYYTTSAKNLREPGKQRRIKELKNRLNK